MNSPIKIECPFCHQRIIPDVQDFSLRDFFIFIILLCFVMVPGIIYAIWHCTKKECPECKKPLTRIRNFKIAERFPIIAKQPSIIAEKPLIIAKQPLIIAIIMLFLAIPPIWPYGYYMLLRLVVCSVSIYVLIKAKDAKVENLMWGMGFIALLFNPLIPIFLGKGIWAIIDITVAIVFIKLIQNSKR